MRFEFLLLRESSAACRQSLEYDPSNTEICICPHRKIAFLYVLMNVAQTDAVWHLRFFRKCTIWWLHDKGLDVFPNSECTMFIFKLADEKKTKKLLHSPTLFQRLTDSPPPSTTKWFLHAKVNMERSHSSSTVNPPKHHRVLTAKQERESNEHSSALSLNANARRPRFHY